MGLVVGKVAVNREVKGVFSKLCAPGQHGPGKTNDHKEGHSSSHGSSIQCGSAGGQECYSVAASAGRSAREECHQSQPCSRRSDSKRQSAKTHPHVQRSARGSLSTSKVTSSPGRNLLKISRERAPGPAEKSFPSSSLTRQGLPADSRDAGCSLGCLDALRSRGPLGRRCSTPAGVVGASASRHAYRAAPRWRAFRHESTRDPIPQDRVSSAPVISSQPLAVLVVHVSPC